MTDIKSYLLLKRQAISEVLDRELPALCEDTRGANPWDFPICSELLQYTKSGKMVRGALVCASNGLLSRGSQDAVTTVAAVMELIQSFLLIHDDMMDQDETRRGLPAIHARYRDRATAEGITAADHFGASMSVCVGDVAYLIAMRLLGSVDLPASIVCRLLSIISREVTLVGVAQMSDLYQGVTRRSVTSAHIKTLYVHKTGRYTFSLPMLLGATIAGASEEVSDRLSHIGELLGYVFQMKDDELGVFADQGELGKPVGSDIAADKKTLLRQRLFAVARGPMLERLTGIFGRRPVSDADLAFVKKALHETGVRADIEKEMRDITDEAIDLLRALPAVSDEQLSVFVGLAEYNLSRTE